MAKSVSVSELKAHLSEYLRQVRGGAEIQVVQRGVAVARLLRLEGAPLRVNDRRNRLIRDGLLRPGRGPSRALANEPLPALPAARIAAALDEERGDRV